MAEEENRRKIDLQKMLLGTNLYCPEGEITFSVSWEKEVGARGFGEWLEKDLKKRLDEINIHSGARIVNTHTVLSFKSVSLGTYSWVFSTSLLLTIPGSITFTGDYDPIMMNDPSILHSSREDILKDPFFANREKIYKILSASLKKEMADIILSYLPKNNIEPLFSAASEDCFVVGYENDGRIGPINKKRYEPERMEICIESAIHSIKNLTDVPWFKVIGFEAKKIRQKKNEYFGLIKIKWGADTDNETRMRIAKKINEEIHWLIVIPMNNQFEEI